MALVLAGVVLDVFLDGWNEYVGTAALLLAIGAGVWLIVYTGVMHARTDVDAYNLEIAEKMSYQEIDEVADPALRGQLRLHKRRRGARGKGVRMLRETHFATSSSNSMHFSAALHQN